MKSSDLISRLRFPVLFTGILALLVTGFNYRKSFLHDLEGVRKSLEQENQEAKNLLERSKKIAKQQAQDIK